MTLAALARRDRPPQWARSKALDHADALVASGVLRDETEKAKMTALFNAFAALERPVRACPRLPPSLSALSTPCCVGVEEGLRCSPQPACCAAVPFSPAPQCRTCRLCNKFRLVTAKELEAEAWSCKDSKDKKARARALSTRTHSRAPAAPAPPELPPWGRLCGRR